jgi:hypothetical protein
VGLLIKKWLVRATELDSDIPQLIIHNLDLCLTAACENMNLDRDVSPSDGQVNSDLPDSLRLAALAFVSECALVIFCLKQK